MDLRSWERELSVWREKFARRPVPPALEDELSAAAAELEEVRRHAGPPISGDRVLRHLLRLRALWEMLYPDESRTTPA